MRNRSLLTTSLVTCLVLIPSAAWAGTDATTVTINATVSTFAEWDSNTQTITFANPIAAVNQTETASGTFMLYMNGNVTIEPAGGVNGGILKDVATSTQTLTTKYMLTGDVTVQDVAYKAAGAGAGEFFVGTNDYAITHVAGDGAYSVTLSVEMTSPAAAAPNAGNYTCGVVLTATF